MKLFAISDLHLGYAVNRQALQEIPEHPDDWLILAGDVGETAAHLNFALRILTARFARVIWTPGNHDLWTLPDTGSGLRGEQKYQLLVEVCRHYGVLTPEDPFIEWVANGTEAVLAPTFVLYDYTFRPDDVPAEHALFWAEQSGIISADEELLHPDPYPDRSAWCAARCQYTEGRLAAIAPGKRLILINHFPLRADLAVLPRIPRFSIWCGTRRTESWLDRFPIDTAIYGHLHIRNSVQRNGVRYEEVSLGYPQQWDQDFGLAGYLREIQLTPTL
jgi:predicted phosphodiesterase